MADIYQHGETDEIFGWNPARRTTTPLLRQGGSLILQRDLGDAHAGGPQTCRSPTTSGSGRSRRARTGASGYEHVMGCWSIWKFAQNQASGARSSSPTCRSTTSDATIRRRSSTTSRASGRVCRSSRSGRRPRQDTHKPRGQVRRSSRRSPRSTRRTSAIRATTNAAIDEMLRASPDPADVRAGLAGEDDCPEAVNAAESRDQEHLREVAQAREDLDEMWTGSGCSPSPSSARRRSEELGSDPCRSRHGARADDGACLLVVRAV